ncbi:MAG: thymidine phosphorylase, partial [Paracoccaceae bacterium]
GAAIVGATADIAPADRRLYGVRDVTGTVDSLDLITASILSKKLAAGLQALVLDVKCGSGAFMKSPEDAGELAQALVQTANALGCPTQALVTDMSAPLVPALGNAVEIAAVMQVLSGLDTGSLLQLTCALGGAVLVSGGLACDCTTGETMIAQAVSSGRAMEHFARMVHAQGGPLGFDAIWADVLPQASVVQAVTAPQAGYITAMDGEALGLCVVRLGGGRQIESDGIDPAVGLTHVVALGARVEVGQTLAHVHAADHAGAEAAAQAVTQAITIGQALPPPSRPLVLQRITS